MSLKTSIRQVPALFKLICWKKGMINLDVGAGKFFEASKYLEDRGAYNVKYDVNLPTAKVVKDMLYTLKVTTATIANVLNVIPKRKDRIKLLKWVKDQVWFPITPNFIGISVYAGNGSGVRKGFQNNKPLSAYMNEIKEVFRGYTIRKISSNAILITL